MTCYRVLVVPRRLSKAQRALDAAPSVRQAMDANDTRLRTDGVRLQTAASLTKDTGIDYLPPARAAELRALEEAGAVRSLVVLCRLHVSEAVGALFEIATNKQVDPRARVVAAKTILEFGYGRAPQQRDVTRMYSQHEIQQLAEAIILRRAGTIDAKFDGRK